MSLPFARTERALQTDDYRTAWICGLVALPLFVAWLVWFFGGNLPAHQRSQQLAIGDYGTVVATFAVAALPDLAVGDRATLRLQLTDEESLTTVPATVADIHQRADGRYDVFFYPDAAFSAVLSRASLTGEAEVNVAGRSPFRTLLQTNQLTN
ncbi:MAG: hypothetical protein DYG89_32885 [Caldilinea sp. CFX5]|nr:hypothetical protein [Caldilinea sp. CFX5]